jgi:hypothetical protein
MPHVDILKTFWVNNSICRNTPFCNIWLYNTAAGCCAVFFQGALVEASLAPCFILLPTGATAQHVYAVKDNC